MIQSSEGAWLNICGSEWKVLQPDGTWTIIEPLDDLRVRHGSNDYWLTIDCDNGGAYCPPEDIADCWSGLTGNFEASQFKNGGPTGYRIFDCDGLNGKTYTGHSPDFNLAGGRFFITSPVVENTVAHTLPATIYAHEAEVTEVLVFAGERSGHIELSLHELDTPVRVRVYHGCRLIGDSDESGDYFNVFFNAEPPEMAELDCGEAKPVNNFLTVRVDAPAGSRWRLKMGAVNISQTTNYNRAAPCFGTYGPLLPCFINDEHNPIPGEAVYEVLHQIPEAGLVRIDLSVSGAEPVEFVVYYNGGPIAAIITPNAPHDQYKATTLTFNFAPTGGDDFILIRYTAPRSYNNWAYAIYCPNTKGSRINPMLSMPVANDVACQPIGTTLNPQYVIVGKGAPNSDIHYDFSGKSLGDVIIEYYATDPVQFVIYQGNYPNETLLSGTASTITGHNRFSFRFDPGNGTALRIRVYGPCCPDWAFTISSPVPPPVINISDAQITRGRWGDTRQLCFNINVTNKSNQRIFFNWSTSALSALPSPDGSCVVYSAPDPDVIAIGADYNHMNMEGVVEACATSATICVPICGTDLMGPTVQLAITLTNFPQAVAGDIYAVGTIYNGNNYACGQSTNIAVHDAGPEPYIGVGSRRIYTNKLDANDSSSYVMDATVNLPTSGLYTIFLYGRGAAQLVIDCALVATCDGVNVARVRVPLNAGARRLYINYWMGATRFATPGFASMAIIDSIGRVIYVSNANDWRGRVVNPGNALYCGQFSGQCEFLPGGGGVIRSTHEGNSSDFSVGYGAQMIRSSLHENHSPDWSMWTLQFRTHLPAGNYTFVYSADNYAKLYINCNLVDIKATDWRPINYVPFTIGAGQESVLFSVMYQNESGPSWACFAIVNAAGNAVLISNPDIPGIRSAAGDYTADATGHPLHETDVGGVIAQHISTNPWGGGGPNYAWYCAYQEIYFPAGDYYMICGQDLESLQVYVDCQLRMSVEGNGSSAAFHMEDGMHPFIIRKFNARSDKDDWWWFKVYRSDGALMYESRAAGWRAKWADMDFSGII